MDRKFSGLLAALVIGTLAAFSARAADLTVYPGDVPDEQTPRTANDAPAGFGTTSWMNSSTGKVNLYVTPTQLFGHSVNIGDISSISYWTKAPSGGGSMSENWFLNIYTTGPGDATWYGKRFFNSDYTGYTSDGTWHDNTIASMQYSSGAGGPSQSFADWKSTYGSLPVLFFSPQTNSGLNGGIGGNDAQIDGLVVTLSSGESRSVDFAAAVPLPAAAWSGMATLGGLVLVGCWKRRSQTV